MAPALLWAASAIRWRAVRGTRYQRLLWATLLSAAVVATIDDPAVAAAATDAFGATGSLVAAVTEHVLIVVLAAMAIELVRLVGLPEAPARVGLRGRLVVLGSVAVALIATGTAAGRRSGGELSLPGAPFTAVLAVHSTLFVGLPGVRARAGRPPGLVVPVPHRAGDRADQPVADRPRCRRRTALRHAEARAVRCPRRRPAVALCRFGGPRSKPH